MMKRNSPYFVAAIVALITFLCYLPALRNDFVLWDDDVYIFNNIHIRTLDLTFFKWSLFSTSLGGFWHPVTWLSHALDYALWGLDPRGHHVTSILLHALNTFLVVWLIIRLIRVSNGTRMQAGQAAPLRETAVLIAGSVTGMLFGLHPIHVESVAWVSERKDLLYSLFTLLSILAYTGHAGPLSERTSQSTSTLFSTHKQYSLSLVLFALAVASKPMAVTLPAVLLLLDWYVFQRISSLRSFVISLKEKLPFLAVSLFGTIVTVAAQRSVEAMAPLDMLPVPARLLTAVQALAAYLWKMLLPIDLIALYPLPKHITIASGDYVPAFAAVMGISATCIYLGKKQPFWLFAWGYYVVTLLPVLGLFQAGLQSMADRFTYMPGLGPFLIAGIGAAVVWDRVIVVERGSRTIRIIAGAFPVALCIILSFLTVRQIATWMDSITLWSRVIERFPDRVPTAYLNRGLAFDFTGRPDRAIEDFSATIALGYSSSYSYLAYNNRGTILAETGRIEQGMQDLDRAVSMEPTRYLAYSSRGLVLGKIGHFDRAIEDFTRALALNPSHADSLVGRGLAFAETGQLEKALHDLDKAVTVNPYNAEAFLNRGLVFYRLDRSARALSDLDKAISLNPSDHLAYSNRGIVYSRLGQDDRAIEDHTRTIALKPDFPGAYLERGGLYLKTGRPELAVRDLQKACDLGNEEGCEAMNAYKNSRNRHH